MLLNYIHILRALTIVSNLIINGKLDLPTKYCFPSISHGGCPALDPIWHSLQGLSDIFSNVSLLQVRRSQLELPLPPSSSSLRPAPIEAPAQRRPLLAFSTSKAEPQSSTLSLLSHA
nr:hypothetical protein CFP56_17678 [Quercus suber]